MASWLNHAFPIELRAFRQPQVLFSQTKRLLRNALTIFKSLADNHVTTHFEKGEKPRSTENKTMSQSTSTGRGKWLVLTLVLGVVAFMTSPNAPLGGFWGAQAASPAPTGVEMLL